MANKLLQFGKKYPSSNFVNVKSLEFKQPSDIAGL